MERKIRVGIFGVGHNHGAEKVKTLKRRDDVEIVGLCEENAEMLAKRLKENADVYGDIPVVSKETLFVSGLDAALVETSVPELVDMSLACAEHGLHVHMDKPAGTDLKAYAKLLKLLEEKNLVFQTGYMYRYNAGYLYLKEKIEEGALGKIYNVSAQMSTKHPVWFKKQLLSYGVQAPVMYIFGGHLLDLCMKIKGEPKSVQAWHFRSQNDEVDLEDTSLAVLSYEDGAATIKVSSVEVNGWGMREFTVCGEKGTIALRPIENPLTVHETYLDTQQPWQDRYTEVPLSEAGRYDLMMQEFVESVRGDRPNDSDYKHEYLLQKYTLEACGYKIEE